MRRHRIAASLVVFMSAAAVAQPPAAEPKFEHPAIPGYGGVVVVPDGAEPPRPGAKILVDLTAGAEAGGEGDRVNAGLDKVARYVNLYAAGGVRGDDVRIAVVIHGDAVKCALDVEGNERNRELIRRLHDRGVEFLVCGQALAHQGHRAEQVSAPVRVAVSALTASVNRQADGYAYVPLK